jgi:muramoyltetrapeptide carboxypeptidase
VCSPAGPADAARLERGIATLEGLGLRVRRSEGLRDRHRFMAGTVDRRVADLQALFGDDEVKAVFCARGGAGALQVLPRLRFEPRPKIFVGYSDLTFLHLFLQQRGLVTLHGPMVAPDLGGGAWHRESLLHGLFGEGAPYVTEPDDLVALRRGFGEGRLLGGCLAILSSAAGTRWALRPSERTILFLEDVDEPPYRIDRMLLQLRHSGALDGVAGIVLGDMRGCAPKVEADYSLENVILAALDGLDIPIAMGLSSGHTRSPNVTLPFGTLARLQCDGEGRFELLEPAVV